jgi:hypothetical protein
MARLLNAPMETRGGIRMAKNIGLMVRPLNGPTEPQTGFSMGNVNMISDNVFDILKATIEVEANGTKNWYNANGKLHRVDGPAVEHTEGTTIWYLNGKCHRVDGPAVEYAGGLKEWWVNGKQHRVDGPAVIHGDGSKEWYVKNKLHRTDGPAVESINGDKMWYIKGKLHRVDGPAIECDGGKYDEWWVNGVAQNDK